VIAQNATFSRLLLTWKKLEQTGTLCRARLPAADNNTAERAIRPFVIGRKNWLCIDTPNGETVRAQLYSLVETAKASGREPYAWLSQTSSVEDLVAVELHAANYKIDHRSPPLSCGVHGALT
jgi:hypothetical protein